MPQLNYQAHQSPLALEAQALNAEYEALKPQLENSDFGVDFLDMVSGIFSIANVGLLPSYTPVDLQTLKANGYTDLATRLETAGALGLESGKKGLVALKKVLASDGMTDFEALTEAQKVALEASDIGNKALAALPRPESLKPGTIENLRALGLTKLATSLEGVGKGLQSGEMAAGFLKGLPNSTFDDKRTEAAIPYAAAPSWPAYHSGYTAYPYYG